MVRIDQYRRLILGLAGFGFLASELVLQSYLWPRFGPTVSVLAGLVPFAIFGAIFSALERKRISKPDPPASFRGKTALKVAVFVLWAVMMASWFPMAEIENSALKQPDRPTLQFTQPLHVKGVVRYVTPRQALIDEWSQRMFFAGWLIGGLVAVTYIWLEKRRRSKAM